MPDFKPAKLLRILCSEGDRYQGSRSTKRWWINAWR